MSNGIVDRDPCPPLTDLLSSESTATQAGVVCLRGRLEPEHRQTAAMTLACSIARRRLPDERLFQSWHSRATGQTNEALSEVDSLVIQSALLQDVGSPAEPGVEQHLLGLIAEGIWHGIVTDSDVGLGIPIRVEGHDWSVTDRGGDGLTVYHFDSSYCYRLWESKYHGDEDPIRATVNRACRQVKGNALSYLARFSMVAQHLTDDQQLATFYGRLAELWADKDSAAGVGVVVGTDSSHEESGEGCFERMTTYFDLTADQHQGQITFVDGYRIFAVLVQRFLWKGCGLWTEP